MTNPENPWGQPEQPGQPPASPPPSQPGQPPASQWDQPPASQWGQPPTSQWGQQPGPGFDQQGQYGQFGQSPQNNSPYLAAPQPGIIPLRPLTIGEIYDGSIKAIRANPAVMFGITALLVALVSVIELVASRQLYSRLDAALGSIPDSGIPSDDDLLKMFSASAGQMAFSSVATMLMGIILNGLLIYAVAQAVIGRQPTIGQTWGMVKGRLLPLLGLTIVVSFLVLVPIIVAFGLLLLATTSGSDGLVALVGIAGLLIGLVATLALLTLTTLATPALILERSGVMTALKRSWKLTKPHFWRIFGILLLTNFLILILASIITTPFSMVLAFFPDISITGMAALSVVGTAIGNVIVYPFMAAVTSLLYIDVRIRSEALDIELAAAARQE